MSTNYSADLKTRVEPCVFGGDPACSQCGCAISSGLHWVKDIRLAPGLKVEDVALTSPAVGEFVGRFRGKKQPRWNVTPRTELVKISASSEHDRKAS